ncbi:MAG: metallophosphoesterase family protein [Dehalococcoidia bacterium]|nr:metallophosphoesterase family protein [Dehalococcoidia bacterium]
MRIGLISDTHVPQAAARLLAGAQRAFHGVELILDAGDILNSSALDQLEHIAPVLAARRDGDNGAVLEDSRVKWRHVLRLHGQTI